jgi:polysaccharide biosynthesis/export protein
LSKRWGCRHLFIAAIWSLLQHGAMAQIPDSPTGAPRASGDPYQTDLAWCYGEQASSDPDCFRDGTRVVSASRDDSGRTSQITPNAGRIQQPGLIIPQSTQEPRADRPAASNNQPEYRVIEPPTEFQKFVAASTGKMLPIFGEWLFEGVPSTFSPADKSPVPSTYRIGPGDELQVAVWGQVNFSSKLVVDPAGNVVVPGVGPVSVAGLLAGEAAGTFKSALSRIYRGFDVATTISGLRTIQVFVVGEARRPGSYMVGAFSTLVNAVFASGGPSSRGSMRDIQLKRGDRIAATLDLYNLLVNGDKSGDAQLQQGDVILIPAAGPRVAIAGSIGHAAIYELKSGATLGDMLRTADGLSPVAAAQQAILDRVTPAGSLQSERVPLNDSGLGLALRNGDIVQVLALVPRFESTVTLRGNVADPGRFAWRPGMKISDLIPDKEALLTRDYWAARNRLLEERSPSDGANPLLANDRFSANNTNRLIASIPVNTRDPIAGRDDPRAATPNSTLGAAGTNSALGAAAANSALGGAISRQAMPHREFAPRNAISPPAPDIDWEYAVIERVDPNLLTTSVMPFDLGKAVIQRDPAADVTLQPGDIVTIFSRADFATPRENQPRSVKLEGEIVRAGTYTLLPGETLREVVERAGGLTADAYLYGAQFTRESTRREQQRREEEFLNQLERDVNETASMAAGRITSSEQAAISQSSLAAQREMIAKLREVQVDGRIVLNLDPASRNVEALPDIQLENEDRLLVPGKPATVNVIGSVASQATFLYSSNLQLGAYLRKAGGPTRFADRSQSFVIRADGSVISQTYRPARGTRNFDDLKMYPGDTLVMPTNVNKMTKTRILLDWSQIFSSFALGAAAASVFKN